MSTITELVGCAGNVVTGVYLAFPDARRISCNGHGYRLLTLQDTTGKISAYAWDTNYRGPVIDAPTAIRAKIKVKLHDHGAIVALLEASILPLPVATGLAKKAPKLNELLAELRKLMDQLTSEPLRSFVGSVLADNALMEAFCRAPASRKFHHNYPSGLLEHSLEVAQGVAQNKGLGDEVRELAVVGALFHDIGKIRTLADAEQGIVMWPLIDHDQLTTEILAAPLRNLDAQWRDGAIALRHIWTRHYKRVHALGSATVAAEIVRLADRMSARQAK